MSTGNADVIAKTLQDVYKASPSIRISSAGTNTVLVFAGAEDQIEIAKHIIGSTDKGVKTELIDAGTLDAAKVAETLKGMFGDPTKGSPYIEAQTDNNAIAVRGTPEQIMEVQATIKALGGGGTGFGSTATGNMRIITLEKGSAATLAEALERMLPQLRQNPVQIITPGGPAPSAPKPKPKEEPAAPTSGGGGPGLVDPQENKPKPAKDNTARRPDSPVRISAAFGNRLIISSDDPEALKMAQELVRLFTKTPGGEGDFEVIRLKNASATEAAKVLDEAFNGPRQQAQPALGGGPGGGPGGGGGGGFGRGGFFNQLAGSGAAAGNARKETVRIVADPNSNSLLVRASPLDMLTIRRLLEKAIDSGESDSNAVQKTFVIGPLKYANAAEVATVLKDVYREQTNTSPTTAQVGGFRGFGFNAFAASNRNVDASGNIRQVTLSIGVDDRTNSIVLQCTSAMHEDIKKLVDNLELKAKDSTRSVEVISIKGADPLLVQQAIEAVTGRTSLRRTPATSAHGGSPFRTASVAASGGGNNAVGGGGGGGRGEAVAATAAAAADRVGGRSGGQQRKSDFFAQRVKDDPQPLLNDPQDDATESSEEEQQAPRTTPDDQPAADRPADAASGHARAGDQRPAGTGVGRGPARAGRHRHQRQQRGRRGRRAQDRRSHRADQQWRRGEGRTRPAPVRRRDQPRQRAEPALPARHRHPFG